MEFSGELRGFGKFWGGTSRHNKIPLKIARSYALVHRKTVDGFEFKFQILWRAREGGEEFLGECAGTEV